MRFFLKKSEVLPVILWTALVLTSTGIYSQTSFTKIFRPGPADGIDAQAVKIVGCNPGNPNAESGNVNYANNPELNMSQWTYNGLGCGEGTIRSFIKFTQLNTIPAGAVIQSAKLSLYGLASSLTGPQGNSYYPGSPYNSYGENKCWIQKVTADWNENTLTYNNQPATTSANQAEIPVSTSQFNSNALNIDVTQLVKDIMTGQNYGFMIRQQVEQYYRNLGFSSSDATDSTRWPKLEVTYTTSAANPTLNIGDITVPENTGVAQLSVCLSAPSTLPVTFSYKISHGSATAGQDYINTNGAFTIPAGEVCAKISIAIVDDNIKESTEDIVFVIENAINASIGDAYGAINIDDNDQGQSQAPNCTPLLSPADGKTIIPSAGFVSFKWKKEPNASSYDVYIWKEGPLPTAPVANVSDTTFNGFPVENEMLYNWYVVPKNSGGSAVGCDAAKSSFVPTLPVINVFDATVSENTVMASLKVCLSVVSPVDVLVSYAVTGGSAIQGVDYMLVNGTLTIPAGQTCVDLPVSIIDDTTKELTEDIRIRFSNPVNGTIGDGDGVVNIIDNESNNTFACTGNLEPTNAATLSVSGTVRLKWRAAPGAISYDIFLWSTNEPVAPFATNIADTFYNASGLSGSTLYNWYVRPKYINGAANDCTVFKTIFTTAVPVLTVNSITVKENENIVKLIVKLSAPSSKTIGYTFKVSGGSATKGEDYIDTYGDVNLPPGFSEYEIITQIIDDSKAEPTENIVYSISNPLNATIANTDGIITIIDDDTAQLAPVASINDVVVPENNGTAQLKVCIPTPHTQPITVKYKVSHGSAIAGQDFVATSGTLIIPAGQTCASFNVSIVDDTQKEPTEDIVFIIYEAVNATIGDAYGAINIVDNDGGNFVCPPGAICISNVCPSSSVNLNDAYSIANLPTGTSVSWHNGTPATDANNIGTQNPLQWRLAGNVYAAVHINGTGCYSSTVLVVVDIKTCVPAAATASSGATTNASVTETGNKKISIAPNPFINGIRAGIYSPKEERAILTVLDIFGREIKTKTVQLNTGQNQISIEGLERLPAGNYLLRVATGANVETYKIVKQE
jgi:Calx-beta domain